MEWKELLCPLRPAAYQRSKGQSQDLRSEFEKDYHRIIGSSAFRRLQDKTQVFPLDKSDFIRTRLTHSLEVSSFAKSLGQNIASYLLQNEKDESFTVEMKSAVGDILQCAGLIHDIGNPPFGHFGEEAIREWFSRNLPLLQYHEKAVTDFLKPQMLQDFYHFEGNAQALRQVSKLHFLVNEQGMNLTYGLLGTIVKYPVSSLEFNPGTGNIKEKKMGFFYAERSLFQEIQAHTHTKGNRHPLTFILEAADDIAYRTADIEDAFKKGCISYEELLGELLCWQEKEKAFIGDRVNLVEMLRHQYQNAVDRNVSGRELYAVQNWVVRLQSVLIFCATEGFISHYRQIMQGNWSGDLFEETEGKWVMEALGDIAYRYVFTSKSILELEIAAGNILNFLLDKLVPAVLYYDTDSVVPMLDRKLISLISENYRQIYHAYSKNASEQERLYLRLLLVTDFVSGMTDSYAKDLYQKLNGIWK